MITEVHHAGWEIKATRLQDLVIALVRTLLRGFASALNRGSGRFGEKSKSAALHGDRSSLISRHLQIGLVHVTPGRSSLVRHWNPENVPECSCLRSPLNLTP